MIFVYFMVNGNFLFVGTQVQDRHASNPLVRLTYHCVILVDPQIGGEEGAREAALSHSLKCTHIGRKS